MQFLMVALLLFPFVLSANAKEDSMSKIERIPLLTAKLSPKKETVSIEVKRIIFNPAQKTGLHSHPIPVIGLIEKGVIHFQIEGEEAKTIRAGETFFEPADKKILHFDNASDTDQASFVAFYLMGASDKDLIKMLD